VNDLSADRLLQLDQPSLFGRGIYLSSELSMSLPYSAAGYGWGGSILGCHLSCVALCELVDHPDLKCQAPGKYRNPAVKQKAKVEKRLYYQWQEYCSLSYVSNSTLRTRRDTTKQHSSKSMDRANIYRIHCMLFYFISFRFQVVKFWRHLRELYLCHWWYLKLKMRVGTFVSDAHMLTSLLKPYNIFSDWNMS